MKKSSKQSNAEPSEGSIKPIRVEVDPRPLTEGPIGPGKIHEFENHVRAALSKHLHDLLNSLWPVAARIELAIIEKKCPPEFHELLLQLGNAVEEAMTIASKASSLVDSRSGERTP